MKVFKDLFEYDFYTKNDGIEISYRAITDSSILIAAYIYRYDKGTERIVVYKGKYNKDLSRYHVSLESGRYQLKFFVKSRNENAYLDSLLTPTIDLSVLENYLPQLYLESYIDETIKLLARNGLNAIDFKIIMQLKHGSSSCPAGFLNNLAEVASKILSFESYNTKTSQFLLNCIFYTSNKDFLVLHRNELIFQLFENGSTQDSKDILFWFGVMEYKLESYFTAYQAFSKLIKFKDKLSFHQTGCISYLHSMSLLDSQEVVEDNITIIDACNFMNVDNCILISCDYGYYMVYVKNRLKEIGINSLVHIHFVLFNQAEVEEVNEDLKGLLNINYSYEIVSNKIGNIKTYCSIARYLVLNKILKKYNLPVLVADADLDFNLLNLEGIFEGLGGKDILLRKTSSDLPWLKVLAGFNIFGYETFDTSFLRALKKYLIYCYYSGRDGWMLDQVALTQCMHFHNQSDIDNDTNILNLDDFVKVNVKQVISKSDKELARNYDQVIKI